MQVELYLKLALETETLFSAHTSLEQAHRWYDSDEYGHVYASV